MKPLKIDIFTTDLVWMGVIEEIETLNHRTSWHEIANSEIRISRKSAAMKEIQIGRILVVNAQFDKALMIEEIITQWPDNYITVNCTELKGIMNWRYLTPIDSGDYVDVNQAYLMMSLVKSQLVTQTRDTKRYFTNTAGTNIFDTATTKNFGEIVDFRTVEWNTGFLGDILSEIARMGTASPFYIGWNIYINSTIDALRLDVYQGTDRSISQTARPAVIFSSDFGNIINNSYTRSIKDWKNAIYVTYDLDGTSPSYTGIQAATRDGAVQGFNRKEMYINSNQITSKGALAEGYAELGKRPKIVSFTAEIIDNPNTISKYGVDWFLGDIVTIQDKDLNVSMDIQVLELEEIYADQQYSIVATFGESKPSVFKTIKNSIRTARKIKK